MCTGLRLDTIFFFPPPSFKRKKKGINRIESMSFQYLSPCVTELLRYLHVMHTYNTKLFQVEERLHYETLFGTSFENMCYQVSSNTCNALLIGLLDFGGIVFIVGITMYF